MKRLIGYFGKGLLFVVPIAITSYIVWWIFSSMDALYLFVSGEKPFPGMGLIVVLALITIIGFLASNIFTRWILNLIKSFFNRLPLIKLLYNSIRDLIGAFVGDKKMFDKPVLVKLWPESEVKVIGFITRDSLDFLGIKEHVAVYLPQSYNFAGNLIICRNDQVIPVKKESSEVMTFIVSAGVSGK